jgi:LysR family glycine cleavage system transcriptional activator
MMTRRLPSMRFLTAFEAIARHRSISRAADELGITQAAASIRLKGLEELLGYPILLRGNGQFSLTPAGERYLATVHKVIADLSEAAERAKRPAQAIRLTVLTALAQKWLIPRLIKLMEHAQGTEIELHTIEDETRNTAAGNLFIRLGKAADIPTIKLIDDEYVAVCRPEIVDRVRPFQPKEPGRVKWLHETAKPARHAATEPLVAWLGRIGLAIDDVGSRIGFRDQTLLVDAALNGVGVALARHSLVVDHLAERQLVRLCHHSVPAEAIYLAYASEAERNPAAMRIRDWLIDQAATRQRQMIRSVAPVRILQSA